LQSVRIERSQPWTAGVLLPLENDSPTPDGGTNPTTRRGGSVGLGDLTGAFANVDLSAVKGLDSVKPNGPSTIGIDTLILSKGEIPARSAPGSEPTEGRSTELLHGPGARDLRYCPEIEFGLGTLAGSVVPV